MKNLNVTNKFPKNHIRLAFAGIGMAFLLTGCGFNESSNIENDVSERTENNVEANDTSSEKPTKIRGKEIKEGILVIGDEKFLIEYTSYVKYVKSDKISIELVDGTWLDTTSDNFYMYEKDSETMNKIKELIIKEEHIIK